MWSLREAKEQLALGVVDSKLGQSIIRSLETQGEIGVSLVESVHRSALRARKRKQRAAGGQSTSADYNQGLVLNSGDGALHAAVRASSNGEVTRLVTMGADVNELDDAGYAPLHVAAKVENTLAARILLKNGADTRIQTGRGATALHIACMKGNTAMCRFILQGAIRNRHVEHTVSLVDVNGRTPIDIAHAKGYSQITGKIEQLLKREKKETKVVQQIMDINARPEFYAHVHSFANNGGALHWIMQHGHSVFLTTSKKQVAIRLVRKLIVSGADFNEQDASGRTPLHIAAFHGNVDCARELFLSLAELERSHELKTDAQDFLGWTPLFIALDRCELKFVKLLVRKQVSLQQSMMPTEMNPLHLVAQHNHDKEINKVGDLARYLLDEGVNFHSRDAYGNTPRDIAVRTFGGSKVQAATTPMVAHIDAALMHEKQRAYRVEMKLRDIQDRRLHRNLN